MKSLHMQDSTDCPEHNKKSINEYVERGIPQGDALDAIFMNNLRKFFWHADGHTLANCVAIYKYIYNKIPMDCWGSKEKYENWVAMGGAVGAERFKKWGGKAFALAIVRGMSEDRTYKISRRKLAECPLTTPEEIGSFLRKESVECVAVGSLEEDADIDLVNYTSCYLKDPKSDLDDSSTWQEIINDIKEASLRE